MSKKILIVEDDMDFANLVGTRLTQAGYATCAAKDGGEALKKIETEKPDLILLDIIMPGMDGYSFLKEMKNRYSVPVIVLTGKKYMKELFKTEGVSDYIVKPFEDEDLLLRISRVLQK